ncbi:FMN-binding protein [Planotetraspora mira]|uniref:FMN-binding protein n=1 Tax=Planotetraspora mira TaxID=58121 RepID=A0A8J3XBR1_9ACTN|nr:FMN-binding protein [Planotetraspora mira]GII34474.1 FMN-binding protein [Planotetraspora mira]
MRRAILAVLATAVGLVLLLSFKPHEITALADPPAAVSDKSNRSSGDMSGDGSPKKSNSPSTSGAKESVHQGNWTSAGAGAGATSGDKVVTGGIADTRWGPVQVEIVLSGGKLTGVNVLQAPDGNNRDFEINTQALPILNQETLSAQSGRIDSVSGATYTSEGYIASLQSAIDKAGL